MRGQGAAPRPDALIAELAGRQHGVVSRDQLRGLGLSPDGIDRRIAAGRVHPLHRGVYAVGHLAVSGRGRWTAAVLAIGKGAALSHQSAAAAWDLYPTSRAQIDVTTASRRRPRPGIVLHRCPLPDDERSEVHGIPVTGPSRTLFDLAAVLRPRQLERAFRQAETLRLHDPVALSAILARYPRRPGAAAMRALLTEEQMVAGVTRSELEIEFLEFLDERGLPQPHVNQAKQFGRAQYEPDCHWPGTKVAVELDSRRFHFNAAANESDRKRDRAMQSRGWIVMRVTARALRSDADELDRELRTALGLPFPAAALLRS